MDQIQRNKEVSSNGEKVVVLLKLLCYLLNYVGGGGGEGFILYHGLFEERWIFLVNVILLINGLVSW